MLPPLASLDAFADRLGVQYVAEPARAAAALADASTLVRAAAARAWVDSEGNLDSPPDLAVTITLEAAKRGYLNPDGYIAETIGDYSYQRSPQRAGTLPGGVYLTDAEREQLRPRGRRTRTITLGSPWGSP